MRVSVLRNTARLALVACVIIGGPSASTSPQSVDEIVSKHIQARGGYDKLKAIQTIKMTRTVATPFTNVELIVYKKRPNLLRYDQTPKGQTTAIPRAINAEAAWDTAGGKIVTRPDKVALEGREVEADFDGLLVDWKEKGHTVALEGTESYAGSQAYKLKVTTKGGFVRHLFIDTKTFMEIGMTGTSLLPQMDPKTKEFRTQEQSFVYSDFREVNGVKFPFSVDEERIAAGPVSITQSFATYTARIEVNVPMDDALFATPQ